MNKRILLIATVYRVGERIYSTIPKLSKLFNIDLLTINQMSDEMNWYGDDDPRQTFHSLYDNYFDNIYDAGFESTNVNPSPLLNNIDINKYDLILYDDDRKRHGIGELYNRVKQHNVPMVGCIHGAGVGFGSDRFGKISDKLFVFGEKDHRENDYNENIFKIGIPSNDVLKHYRRLNNHILVVVNYLGNRNCPYPIQVDREYIEKTGLGELQKEFNRKIVFKLKSRLDHPYPQKDIDYLNSIVYDLDCEIIMDCEDNNKLIADSLIVISAPSTLSFKSIQLGIPTILIKGSGESKGHFVDFKGLVDLDTQVIFDEIERQDNNGKDKDFILDTIEGGIDFSSTEKFIKEVENII